MINRFLEENYDEIVKMAEKITQDENYREIAHYVIEQFMNHDRCYDLIEEGNAMRFMSGMIHRNYHSSTSPYHKLFRQKGRVHANDSYFRNTYSSWEYGDGHYDRPNRSAKGQKTVRQKIQEQVPEDYDIETDMRLDAIEGILEDMMSDEQHLWYLATLFRMWLETPNYSEMERQTKIPRTSISQAVNECRQYIQQKLKDNGYDI